MKNRRVSRDGTGNATEKSNGPDSSKGIKKKKKKMMMMKKKNLMRLGSGGRGGGLSLEAFANAKTRDNHYNPAFIKKQREFYKNAKYVSKYKKSLKPQSDQNDPPTTKKSPEDENGIGEASKMEYSIKKNKKDSSPSLNELYEKKRVIGEKARAEKEAIIKAKKEEREIAETRRKALREKMFKRTKSGQPVMKYRIEHLLQTLQGSTS